VVFVVSFISASTTTARFVIFRSASVRPKHLFDPYFDHDYLFKLPLQGAGCPFKFAAFYCTPCPVPSFPTYEPNSNDDEYSTPFRHIQYKRMARRRPIDRCGSVPVHHTHRSLPSKMQSSESSGDNLTPIIIMSGSFLPSLWSSSNHSLLGSRESALLCNQVCTGTQLFEDAPLIKSRTSSSLTTGLRLSATCNANLGPNTQTETNSLPRFPLLHSDMGVKPPLRVPSMMVLSASL
jgi:hypothetical protein